MTMQTLCAEHPDLKDAVRDVIAEGIFAYADVRDQDGTTYEIHRAIGQDSDGGWVEVIAVREEKPDAKLFAGDVRQIDREEAQQRYASCTTHYQEFEQTEGEGQRPDVQESRQADQN